VITQAMAHEPTSEEATPRHSRTAVNGSRTAVAKRRGHDAGRCPGTVFSPHRANRSSASASVSPRGPVPSRRRTSSVAASARSPGHAGPGSRGSTRGPPASGLCAAPGPSGAQATGGVP
jgi:hypothetical protein